MKNNRTPASDKLLKKAILKEVYKDNLRIADALPASKRQKKAFRKDKTTRFFPYLIFPVLIFLVGLGVKTILLKGQTPTPATVTAPQVFADHNIRDSQQPSTLKRNTDELSKSAFSKLLKQNTDELFKVAFAKPLKLNTEELSTPVFAKPLKLDTDKLLNYKLMLNDSNVRLSSVFGVGVQNIVIDPGHGGKDPGAIGPMGTKEKDIVLDIALRLRDKLRKNGKYNVFMTREKDTYLSLAERVKFANAKRADLFISIHINSLPQKQVNLIETYYYGPPSDKGTLRLAEQENKHSGVQTKDFADMIKKIGNTFKEQESVNLATSIQQSLFFNIKKHDHNIGNAGIKFAPFVVLLGVDAPSVLVEISCISDKQEEAKLNTTSYRSEVASFLADGIIHYLTDRHLHLSGGEINGKEKRDNSG
jgi:N-acetylmuramoyl-L-alanine amidase